MEQKLSYTVAVFGFTSTENVVLNSIFGLSARRVPMYTRLVPGHTELADLYLVDLDSAGRFEEFQATVGVGKRPVILVGTDTRGLHLPLLGRPLQWGRMLAAFDQALEPLRGSSASHVTQPAVPPAALQEPKPAVSALTQHKWALVVDDSATLREFMRAKLAPFKINVDFAESGEEAIGMTAKHNYSCVFLDVVMPGMDGYQVCRLIKQRKNINKTAVVMLTSKDSQFNRIRGTMVGCDAYLTKPVNEDKLLETIAKYLTE